MSPLSAGLTGSHGGPNERGALSCQGFTGSRGGGGKLEIEKQRLRGEVTSAVSESGRLPAHAQTQRGSQDSSQKNT